MTVARTVFIIAAKLLPFAPPAALLSAATLLIVGGLVAYGGQWPAWLGAGAGALIGAVHGFANGMEAGHPFAVLGVVAAAAVLAAAGLVLSAQRWAAIPARVLGSWVAALGLILIGLVLRG